MKSSGFKISKVMTALVVLSPLFLQYVIFFDFLLLPEFFLIAALFFAISSKPTLSLRDHRLLVVYFYFVFVDTLIVGFLTSYFNPYIAATTYIRFLFYAFVVVYVSRHFFDIDFGANLLIKLALGNAIYGLIQYVAYTYFSVLLPWSLPFLKMQYGGLLVSESDYFISNFGYRFSGLFSEPAHFSQYIGLALIFILFYDFREKISLKYRASVALIFLIALILIGSGTAVFVVALIAVFSVAENFFRKRKKSSGAMFAFLAFLAVIGLSYMIIVGGAGTGVDRLSSAEESSSLYVRVMRPIEIYLGMPGVEKIFGIGYGNYAQYVGFHGLLNFYELDRDIAWANTAGFILVGCGAIGFSLYLAYLFSAFRKSDLFNRYLVIYVIAHVFFSDLPLSLFYVAIMTFVFSAMSSRLPREALNVHEGVPPFGVRKKRLMKAS